MRVKPRVSLTWFECKLLDAPVQDLGDVKFVLRGTRHFVDPAELLGLAAGPAEPSQNLSVERKFVDSAGVGIGAVEVLSPRSGRDADGPGRTGGSDFLRSTGIAEPGFGIGQD